MTPTIPDTADSRASAGFIDAICRDPADDNHRLVFADWLEEHGGEPERGEFIRVQVELANAPAEIRADRRWNDLRYRIREPFDRLRRREAELLRQYADQWRAEFAIGVVWGDGEIPPGYGEHSDLYRALRDGATFTRGFPSHLTLPAAAWLADRDRPRVGLWECPYPHKCKGLSHKYGCNCGSGQGANSCPLCHGTGRRTWGDGFAARVVLAVPCVGVRLAELEPQDYHNNDATFHDGRLYGWYRGPHEGGTTFDINPELWEFVAKQRGCVVHDNWADFGSAELAHAALSRAAVALAREDAGLPVLPVQKESQVTG